MSIADALQEVKIKIDKAYQVLEESGATIPEEKNLDNLPAAIESKPGSSSATTWVYYNGSDIEAGKKVLLTKVGYQALGDENLMPDPPKYGSYPTALGNISENGYIVGIYKAGNYYTIRGFDIIDGTASLTIENSFSVDGKVVYRSPFFMLNGSVLGRSSKEGMTLANSDTFVLNSRTNYYRGSYSTSTSSCYVFLDFCYYRTNTSTNLVLFNEDLTYTSQTSGSLIGSPSSSVFYAAGSKDLFYVARSTTSSLTAPEWEIYKLVKDGDTYTSTLIRTYEYTPVDRFVDSSTIALGCKDSIKVGDNRLYFLVHKRNYLYFAINEVDETQSAFEVCNYPENIATELGTRTIEKVQTFYDGTFSMDLSDGTTIICKFTDKYSVEILETIEPFVIEGDEKIYHRCFSETKVYWYIEGLSDPINVPYYGYYDKIKATSDYLAISPSAVRFNSTILTGFMTGETTNDNGRTMIEVETVLPK